MPNAFAALHDRMALYFDGLYHADTARLKRVFHPQARYVNATDTPPRILSLDAYFPMVAAREAPAQRQELRHDAIVSIELAGPNAAFVRAHCAIGPKYFTDLLTFIREDGEWRIISKVFHYDRTPGTAVQGTHP